MSVLIKNMEMPKGCIYANDNDQTEYCPLLNHDDVPFCQYIESEPEIAIGIDERPVYCPLSDVPEPCENAVSRQAAIDAIYETFCYAYCDNCEKEMNEDLCGDCHRKYQNWAASKNIISKTINSLPSAQPEVLACGNGELIEQPERKKGKWLELDFTEAWEYKCDQCGRLSDFEENYCPSCGADMRGEQP